MAVIPKKDFAIGQELTDFIDMEEFEDADCDRFDDLMVHFEGIDWSPDRDDTFG